MKCIRISVLAVVLILISAGGALADHLPDVFQVLFPVGDTYAIRSDRIGAGTYEGLGATWTVNDYDAQIVFDNSFLSTTVTPYVIWEWHLVDEVMPLSVNITSTTGGQYSIVPIIQTVTGGAQDFSLAQYDLTGNTYFGQHMPVADLITLRVTLEDPSTLYDLTVDLSWGSSVPNEEHTWGDIKSLYR